MCFYIQRRLRRQGLAKKLLSAAIDHAAARGADLLEAYPVDPDSPSYRYGGQTAMFREAGFEEVGRAGTRRHIMRLTLNRR